MAPIIDSAQDATRGECAVGSSKTRPTTSGRPVQSWVARAVTTLASLVILAAVACGGHVPIDGRACPCLEGWVCCAGSNVCARADAAGGACSAGVAATPTNIQTLCAAPRGGTLGPPATAAALSTLVNRRWLACHYDATSKSGLEAHEGLEFTSDGRWYFLRSTNGGFERDPDAESTGAYQISNLSLPSDARLVGPSDTTFGRQLLLEWLYRGRLELEMDFEQSPFRFRTWNGIDMWFVALESDGAALEGTEGMACDSAGVHCQDPIVCVSENNSGVCSKPAVVGRGEGCDHTKPVRACEPGLTCLDTRRCGVIRKVGDACDGILDVCASPATCDRSVCTAPP